MDTYAVSTSIAFCYGHRLCDYNGPCRHLHGHNARVEIVVATDTLDSQGMACDFRLMKSVLKGWIDAHLDHRMILQETDPLVPILRNAGEPLYLMTDPPTAEHIARLLFQHAHAAGLPVREVRLWESDNACAVYRAATDERRAEQS
ncbi:MAG: 6-carboxytetrahydropterin synthase [Deltaproteobacteria bacterium]|nr:6-carboxytetrahydropterin synthase [Deltaproteobacteria bacterium]